MHVANACVLEERWPVIARFMAAYRETLDWVYADPAAFKCLPAPPTPAQLAGFSQLLPAGR